MQDAKWIWLNPEHFPQYQKGQATTFAEKGDFVADYSSGYPGLYMRLTHCKV